MKNMKSFMLVMLLAVGSNVFADRSYEDYKKDFELIKKDIEIEAKKQFAIRENLRKNGTPFEKASILTVDLAWEVAVLASPVCICSHAVKFVLSSLTATENMSHKEIIATGICASTLAALYTSCKYEEMQKSQKKQKSSSWF